MKDYLNTRERDVFLTFVKAIDHAEKIEREWIESKNIDKTELKNLRTLKTYGYKFVESVLKRQSKSSKKSIANALSHSVIVLDYKSMITGILKRRNKDINANYEENKDYFLLVELLMHYNCRNCDKSCNDCMIYEAFEENNIPEFEVQKDNGKCKYSYTKKE